MRARPLTAEALGTGLLLFIVVGSGITAETLGVDPAGRLLGHAIAVGAGLGALIALFSVVSGAHFNPAVTLGFWRSGAMGGGGAAAYISAQIVGGVAGVVAANSTFGREVISIAAMVRDGPGRIGAEAVATFVLVVLILVLVRTGRAGAVPAAVGAWVAAIVFATSSTGFANPAVTISRVFTDSYTGIAPGSVAGFVAAQLLAGLAAAPATRFLLSSTADQPINRKETPEWPST